jgi:hypothetical protein
MRSRRKKKPQFMHGQSAALRELRQLADTYPHSISVVGAAVHDEGGRLQIVVRLSTKDFTIVDGGLPVADDHEDVLINIPKSFPWQPPEPIVIHTRFVGQAHVLQGHRLCIYLDVAREWHPEQGMHGFLDRLWNWFADAAAGKFDAVTALYHPVGGVLHRTAGTPMIVVRKPLIANGKAFLRAALTARTPARIDLARWEPAGASAEVAQVIVLDEPLPYGAGSTLPEMLWRIAETGHVGVDSLATLLARTAARNAAATPLYVIIAVPHPGPVGGHHLLAARLSPSFTDRFRVAVAGRGAFGEIKAGAIPAETPIEWCYVSDERPEIASRRDSTRPTAQFAGRTVDLWGCGALGSWLAEFIARAGAARLVVRDPGDVQGGLLVRQNYVETDIGGNKADQLAGRLRQISDDLIVETGSSVFAGGPGLPDCDLIIDATVNNSVGLYLDLAARQAPSARPMLAQVAIDVRTATLGLLTVSAPGHPTGPADMDQQVGARVLADGSLERFHVLWQEPADGDEIIPARGCSVPTFHGSAADVAGVAASLVSLLGPHLDSGVSGTHLMALPHAPGTGPHHQFLPAPEVE